MILNLTVRSTASVFHSQELRGSVGQLNNKFRLIFDGVVRIITSL
jgi:hypothetical protein